MLRWEYAEPFHYLIILNNGRILIRDDEKKTRIDTRSNKLFAEINEIIIGCVQGNLFNDDRKFSAAFFENNRGYLIKLKPLTSKLKEFLSEIRLYLDKNDCTVTRLEMLESSGDFTGIDFSGKKMNLPIPDDKFRIP
jgi:outer membrane lipoprotein carrier protein